MTRSGLFAAACALALVVPLGAAGAAAEQPEVQADTQPRALIDAARNRDQASALALIDAGADVNVASPDGTTALHWAIHTGDRDLAAALIAAGADVEAANFYGATPMAEAAVLGDKDMLALLLDAGAEVDRPNADGQTPLMVIARSANVDAARLLIERGADVNTIEQWKGQTALMWASAQKQPEMVALLIAHGADPNVRSWANHHKREITAESRYLWRPPGGLTALIYAARQGCAECARELVEGGADVDQADPEGATALLTATMNFNWDTAVVLIEAGANVNKWDWRGRFPLYGAIDLNTLPHGGRPDQPATDQHTALEVARMLLERGANPNLQLKLNPGYRHTKDDRGSDGMVQATGATALLRAAKAFDVDSINLLLEYGAKIDLPNDSGMLPILAAAGMGSRVADTRGYFDTPDVQERSIAALRALIEGGADVDATDDNGQTALFAAAQWGWNDVVAFLVEQGASLDATDSFGRTPLDMANGKGSGRYGASGPVHEDTVALIEQLAEAQGLSLLPTEEEDPA